MMVICTRKRFPAATPGRAGDWACSMRRSKLVATNSRTCPVAASCSMSWMVGGDIDDIFIKLNA